MPEDLQSNVPVTTRSNTWYLHAVAGTKGRLSVKPGARIGAVKSARLLRTCEPVEFQWADGALEIDFPEPARDTPHEVVEVTIESPRE
jgi:hypothetical protein